MKIPNGLQGEAWPRPRFRATSIRVETIQRAWPIEASPVQPAETHPEPESPPRRALGAVAFMGDALRRRRSGRIALWALVVSLALGGVWLLAYPFITDIWADRLQKGLQDQFQALEQTADPNASGYVAVPPEGDALTRLRIPKLGLNMIVVSGVSSSALRAGAGHFPDTALPGSLTGNVVIAGHRTGYGDPFLHVNRLTKGNKIILDTPFGKYIYEVVGNVDGHINPWVVPPTDLTVKNQTIDPMLTLITCDPPGTNKNRLIVRAKLQTDVAS